MLNVKNILGMSERPNQPTDLSMVPDKYQGWLRERFDILNNEYATERTERNPNRQLEAVESYLGWNADAFPEYADLVLSILDDSRGDVVYENIAGAREVRRRSIFPMNPNCRVSINIPAKGEEAQIIQTLASYAIQTNKKGEPLDPSLFEFNVLVNTNTRDLFDSTYDRITDFKDRYPFLKINTFEVMFEDSWARIGMVRKLLNDITLARAANAKLEHALYLESDDADIVWADPKQVISIVDALDKEPNLDGVVGYQEKFLKAISDIEFTFMQQRIWDMIMVQVSKYVQNEKLPLEKRDFENTRTYTFGTSSAVYAETFALAGGYNWDAKVAEDLDLGKRISLLRGEVKNGVFVPDTSTIKMINTRTNTSPRRYIHGLYRDVSQIYSDEAFQNPEARELSLAEMMNAIPDRYRRLTPDSARFFEKELWHQYYELRQMIPDNALAQKIMRRALLPLFETDDVEVTEDEVHIKETRNFSARLAQFRESKGISADKIQEHLDNQTKACERELDRRKAIFS